MSVLFHVRWGDQCFKTTNYNSPGRKGIVKLGLNRLSLIIMLVTLKE